MIINYSKTDLFESVCKTIENIKINYNLIKDNMTINLRVKLWLKARTHLQRLGTSYAHNLPFLSSCCLWLFLLCSMCLFIFLRFIILCQLPIIIWVYKSIDYFLLNGNTLKKTPITTKCRITCWCFQIDVLILSVPNAFFIIIFIKVSLLFFSLFRFIFLL